ncbi:hypothetical protein DICVIV_05733 [Dictyocaulus viviparus]|uniref:PDZ domain-containing protein n=1 Tax=Dictyocaulus viviparus TaxID=29172 RepID=A0A0D8XWJ8_DICVI|nr:hypothetical protein DICVIV_05733 [Dictyocaulus viviparus]
MIEKRKNLEAITFSFFVGAVDHGSIMSGSKKLPVNLISVLPDIPYKKTDATFRVNKENEIDIAENMMIMSISPSAAANCSELIMGDRITKLNGNPVKTKTEAIATLKASLGNEIKAEVLRRQYTSPLTPERAKKIGLNRLDGFAYFLLSCSKENNDPVSSFGFTLKLLKNRAHVIALDPKGVASNFFCIGDALLDLDGTPIPFNDLEFVRGYTQKFNKNNKFTVVIERPISKEALFMYNMLFKLMLPQESDVEMGQDAVLIGKEAANMHRMVFRRLKPKSVYGPKAEKRVEPTVRTVDVSDKAKNIRVASSAMELKIASDIDDEDELKPVDRKSHAKDSSMFDDF